MRHQITVAVVVLTAAACSSSPHSSAQDAGKKISGALCPRVVDCTGSTIYPDEPTCESRLAVHGDGTESCSDDALNMCVGDISALDCQGVENVVVKGAPALPPSCSGC